jgi:hypothetical protein
MIQGINTIGEGRETQAALPGFVDGVSTICGSIIEVQKCRSAIE